MPELPEVEVVRRGVQRWATDGEITAVDVLDPRSLRRHHNGPEDFSAQLIGQHLAAGQRRGKLLWLPFDAGSKAIVVHLGMSGQLLFSEPGIPVHTPLTIPLTYSAADGTYE